MRRLKHLPAGIGVALALMILVSACASLGLTEPKSLDDRLAYAYGNVTGLREATATLLEQGNIASSDGEYVLKVTDQSRAMLDSARTVSDAGDMTVAQDRLEVALAVMEELNKYLDRRSE